jgi:hypothetical protein
MLAYIKRDLQSIILTIEDLQNNYDPEYVTECRDWLQSFKNSMNDNYTYEELTKAINTVIHYNYYFKNIDFIKKLNICYDVEQHKYYKPALFDLWNTNRIYLTIDELTKVKNDLLQIIENYVNDTITGCQEEQTRKNILNKLGKISVTVNKIKFNEEFILNNIISAKKEGYTDIKKYYDEHIKGCLGSEIDRKIINKCYNRINNILEEAI